MPRLGQMEVTTRVFKSQRACEATHRLVQLLHRARAQEDRGSQQDCALRG